MLKAVEEREYLDYDYLDDDEARYQGYDTEEDADFADGFTVTEPEQKTKARENPEKNNGDTESRDAEADENRDSEADDSPDDDDIWLDGDEDINENAEPDDEQMSGEPEADADAPETASDEEAWYEDEEFEPGEKVSPESYVIDGHEYKDPRKYIQALYQRDTRQYPQLKPEKQMELAHAVRRGMLCDCSIMPEDPVVPDEYPYKLVDKTSKVLKRLDQTEEEKAWVESLSLEEKKEYIEKGRTAQEKLISHNLPLVMTIAGEKYKSLEYLDRVQAGNMGLLKAVQYFNPYRENKFATYAAYLIDSEISNYARSLRKQRAASPAETCFVPTDAEIERVVDLMGGVYWMRMITADTDQTPDRIRKQIAVLLQEKKRMEAIANDSIHGPRELTDGEYDDVLKEAVLSKKGRVQRKKHKTGENNSSSSGGKKRNRKLDLLTGDGLPPREDEMSTEDFIRSFFAAVITIKDISPKMLSNYILGERRFLQHKAEALRKFLDDPWAYTDEMAISELETLIRRDNIWPERCLIERTKEWGWLESKYSDKGGEKYTGLVDDSQRMAFSDCVDPMHPTESIALILLEGYLPLRQQDILEDARRTLEYCDWLCEIIDITVGERLNEFDGNILEGLAEGETYRSLGRKYQTYSDKIRLSKQEALASIYDQVVESSNRTNGKAMMQLLELLFRSREYKKWDQRTTNRMRSDHFIEDRPFALRSRGELDRPRPFMELLSKMVTRVNDSVTSAVQKAHDLQAPIITNLHELSDSLSSVDYEELRRIWSEYEDMGDLDDPDEDYEFGLPGEDVTPALNGEDVGTDKDDNSGDSTTKAV